MFYVSRFKDIERREYECEVVTPLFLGGADPGKAELRVPPIKAALRFWWRALYGEDKVESMLQKEALIFGSTEQKTMVSVNLDYPPITPVLDMPSGKMVPVKGKTYKTSIINYLSYGLYEYKKDLKKNVYNKEHIEPSYRFKIVLNFHKSLEADVLSAMKVMITYGGIGARSRNGFGSLHCSDLPGYRVQSNDDLKSYTSFSKHAKLFNEFRKSNTWEEALSEIGERYRDARLRLEKQHTWDERKYIAMPIEAKNEKIPPDIKNGRHAKPYFLHVNKTADGKYQGQILFLPYRYKASVDDRSNRVDEYLAVCGKMNEVIQEDMGGIK